MVTLAKSLLWNALLLISVVIPHFERAEAQCGGFARSCTNYAVDSGGIWISDCKTDSSGSVYTSHAEMSTTQYLGNSNGVLVDGAGYTDTCTNFAALATPDGEVFLQAFCTNDRGTSGLTTYDVNNHIVNINGALSWNYC